MRLKKVQKEQNKEKTNFQKFVCIVECTFNFNMQTCSQRIGNIGDVTAEFALPIFFFINFE